MRDPSEPSANVLSQPSRSRSSGSGPKGAPLRSPARPAAASWSARRQAWTRSGSTPAAARRPVGLERPAQALGRRQAARVVHGDDAEREQVAWRAGRARRRSSAAVGRGTRSVTRLEARSCRTPVGRPVASRRITPPAGSARRSSTPATTSAAAAGDERVVVVGPERDQPARSGAIEVVGGGPSAEGVRVPPSPFDPGVAVAGSSGDMRLGRRADPADELLDGRASVEIHARPLQRGVGQVQVGVGQPGDRHLVIAELQAARPGTGQACDVVRSPGGHHAAPSNRDRLGPRGPVRPGERRDPADHHQVGARGHPASTGSAGASSTAADATRSCPSAASAVGRALLVVGRQPGPPARVLDPGGHRDGDGIERLGRHGAVHVGLARPDRPATQDRQDARQGHDAADPDQHGRRPDEVGQRADDQDRREARDRHQHVQDAEHAATDVLGQVLLELGLRRDRDGCIRYAREEGDEHHDRRAAT